MSIAALVMLALDRARDELGHSIGDRDDEMKHDGAYDPREAL